MFHNMFFVQVVYNGGSNVTQTGAPSGGNDNMMMAAKANVAAKTNNDSFSGSSYILVLVS